MKILPTFLCPEEDWNITVKTSAGYSSISQAAAIELCILQDGHAQCVQLWPHLWEDGAVYCVHLMLHSRGYGRPLPPSSLPLQQSWLFHPTCMCRVAELSLACRVQVCCRTSRLPRVQRQYSTSSEQKGGRASVWPVKQITIRWLCIRNRHLFRACNNKF